jgi:hypothetical protein
VQRNLTTKVLSPEHRISLDLGTPLSEEAALVSPPTTRAPTQQGRTTPGMSPLDVTSCTSFPFSSLDCHSLEANKGVPPPFLNRRCSLHSLPSLHCTLFFLFIGYSSFTYLLLHSLGEGGRTGTALAKPSTSKPHLPLTTCPDDSHPLDTPSTLDLVVSLPPTLAAQATPSTSTSSSSEDSRVRYHLRNHSVVKVYPSESDHN